MVYPGTGNLGGPEAGGPVGYTYGALLVDGASSEALTAALRGVRFSGWVVPSSSIWGVVVTAHRVATVASQRRGVVGVGETLAAAFDGPVLALRVVDDRQLLLVMWRDGTELGRYLSDPSYGLDRDDDTLSFPYGVEHAETFAEAAGHPENGDELSDLLGRELDPDHMIESERLSRVLRLLDLPAWLVAASSLPRDVPTGPRAREVTRLGAGRTGPFGRVLGRLADVVRRRRPPPPPVTDAPRGSGPEYDPWLM